MNTQIDLDPSKSWLMVAYSDGGCRPNPGPAGSGVHAYIAEIITEAKDDTKPLKFNIEDITKYFHATTHGYQYCSKDGVISTVYRQKGQIVKPHYVLEMAESSSNQYTNNYAEVKALFNALKLARQYNIKNLKILSDSDYTLKAVSVFRPIWERNGFMTAQGQPVKNQELFKAVFAQYDACVQSGMVINLEWIKGHSDHPGNHHADILATVGVVKSQQSLDDSTVFTYKLKDYWEPKRDRHPLMSLKRLYFNRHIERNTPGVYYMGDPGKEDSLVGKPLPETVYAVVKMKRPDDITEAVIQAQGRYEQDFNVTMMIKMESIYKPDAFRLIKTYGSHAMIKADKATNVVLPDGQPMSVERNPIGVTMRAVDALNALEGILDFYEANKGITDNEYKGEHLDMQVHDITNQFYDKDPGNQKPVFKKTIVVGQKVHKVNIDIENAPTELPIRLGLDIMDRNSLKQLETSDPVIHLITWRDSSVSLRYASVILCNEGHAIWSNFYADRIMLKKA